MQEQACLVFRETEFAAVGKDYTRVVEAVCHIVYYHVVEHAGLGIFVLHVEVHVRNLVVERAFRNFHLGRFLTHAEKQCPHFALRDGQKVVLEKEGSDAYAHHQHYERAHDFEQGYPGRFHGGELEFFAEVAERH